MSKINRKTDKKFGGRRIRNVFEQEKLEESLSKAPKGSKITYEEDKLKYVIESLYSPDIKVTLPSGKEFYIEVKGNGRAWSPEVRRKMLRVREQNPDVDIRLVFYRDGVFGATRKDGSRQRQSEWAEKNGFQYSIEFIPEEWFQE